MSFAKVQNQEMNIMNISHISAQINEIVEAVLPLQKSSAALHDSLLRLTHAPQLSLYGHYTQGFECIGLNVLLKLDLQQHNSPVHNEIKHHVQCLAFLLHLGYLCIHCNVQ